MTQKQVEKLLQEMSVEEKINQLVQLTGVFYKAGDVVLTGPELDLNPDKTVISTAGSVLGVYGAKELRRIQDEYMKKHPHHIPLLFMMDVIHGMKTIFPIPLAQASSFNPDLIKECAGIAAKEAAVSGIHVVFSPMADLVRDARWGRVMESFGEDPYLNGLLVGAEIAGYQGTDIAAPGNVCACVKHFAAYGAVEAGRDYDTVEICTPTLREFYLPTYEKGIQAGAGMVMTSFNTVNRIPASVNSWLLRNILRNEMGFKGVVISDYSAIGETVAHGYAQDEKDAAQKALEAGVDIDMMSPAYMNNLKALLEEDSISTALLDESVRRVLELKNQLGLFENPYKDGDETKEQQLLLCKHHREIARKAAVQSFVLLENDGILPLKAGKKIAFIGPYTNNKEILSSWAVTGNPEDVVTIKEASKELELFSEARYFSGSPVVDNSYNLEGFVGKAPKNIPEEEQAKMLEEAIEGAKWADVVIMPLGEHFLQSGEATSRVELTIPEIQMRLFRKICEVNPNIVILLFNGRPLDIRELKKSARAILEVWFPGTEGGHAICDVLSGKENPSGKLPMSFPYCVGQLPIYYNHYATGRPGEAGQRYHAGYMDAPASPLYPFGYGKSYTNFEITPISLNTSVMAADSKIYASVLVRNTGMKAGTEILQLYIQDVAASVVRPVKELKAIKRIELKPQQEKKIEFVIEKDMLKFLRQDGNWDAEPGKFRVWIGNCSDTENMATFILSK